MNQKANAKNKNPGPRLLILPFPIGLRVFLINFLHQNIVLLLFFIFIGTSIFILDFLIVYRLFIVLSLTIFKDSGLVINYIIRILETHLLFTLLSTLIVHLT